MRSVDGHPILTVDSLLKDDKRQSLTSSIHNAMILSPKQMSTMVVPLSQDVLLLCQGLPETSHRYYMDSFGMIQYILSRTNTALSLFSAFIKPDKEGQFSEKQQLWQYVLFSAGLFKGMGKLYHELSVQLYFNDKQKETVKWNLFDGLMKAPFDGYTYEWTVSSALSIQRTTPLIAKKYMNESGLKWITDNPSLFMIWLALLNEDMHAAGILGAILDKAEAMVQLNYFDDIANRIDGSAKRPTSFLDGTPIDSSTDKMIHQGMQFIHWLQDKLSSGQIFLNESPLRSLPGGLLILPDTFKWFMRERPDVKNVATLEKALLHIVQKSEMNKGKEGGVILSSHNTVIKDKAKWSARSSFLTGIDVSFHCAMQSLNQQALSINKVLSTTGEWVSAPLSLKSGVRLGQPLL